MSDRPDDDHIAFADFGPLMEAWLDRAREAGAHFQDEKTLLSDFRNLLRAFMMGPAGPLLLFSPRNREALQWLFYVHGFIGKPGKDKDQKELKDLTKDFLLAWLELADEARRHRDTFWDINTRLMEKFGEAIDDVTAEFNKPRP
jgi:hypothetical protein